MAVLQQLKHSITICYSNSTCRYTHKQQEQRLILYSGVHKALFTIVQRWKKNPVPTGDQINCKYHVSNNSSSSNMNKMCKRILFSHEGMKFWHMLHESTLKYYILWSKSETQIFSLGWGTQNTQIQRQELEREKKAKLFKRYTEFSFFFFLDGRILKNKQWWLSHNIMNVLMPVHNSTPKNS